MWQLPNKCLAGGPLNPKTCQNLDLLLPEYKFRHLCNVEIMYGIAYRGNNGCDSTVASTRSLFKFKVRPIGQALATETDTKPNFRGFFGSGAMSGTAVDFSNFSKIRLWGGRGDPID